MRIHFIQHVPFETGANIIEWANHHQFPMTTSLLYQGDSLPDVESVDFIVIMGGPMGIHDEDQYPWLIHEKQFIKKGIQTGKHMIGVCLGAQLLADSLGARVYAHRHKEIGWFPLKKIRQGDNKNSFFSSVPDAFLGLHWHGDTFDIPSNATWLAESEGCPNQCFEFDQRILGIQFHLEMDESAVQRILKNCSHELEKSKFVQSDREISSQKKEIFEQTKTHLFKILDAMHHSYKLKHQKLSN